MSDSSADKGMVPEYSELLNIDETRSNAEPPTLNNNNNSNNVNNNGINSNNKNPLQFGDVEMTSVQISTKSAVMPQSETTPVKAIEKQIETRRADGKRRITPMFVPRSVEQIDR